jgi:hypothetical protein
MNTANFSHTGNVGDVWASIPSMNQFFLKTGRKIRLHLIKNVRAEYYEGATHPTKDDNNTPVMLNEKMIQMMAPLLMVQPCIDSVITTTEEEVKEVEILIHLEWIRESFVGMPAFPIQKWYSTINQDLDFNLADSWLSIPDSEKDLANGKIIITRSERYQIPDINYTFLKPYEDDLLFCGTMREYNQFCMTFDLNIRKFNISNFLELAQAIKQCKFHLSNQTQAFQLSEGQKTPRILEACCYAPNVIPVGDNAHYFLNNMGLEYYFNSLNGTMVGDVADRLIKKGADKRAEMDNLMGTK